jgi:uncharacterized protein (TIGR00255 family)
MTGFGEARRQDQDLAIAVEVRAINNRYFKLNTRLSEGFAGLEPLVEGVVRTQLRRGTIQVNLRVQRLGATDQYHINEAVLAHYFEQVNQFQKRHHSAEQVSIGDLLALPGVVNEGAKTEEVSQQWPRVEPVLQEALAALGRMRAEEGAAMAADLTENLNQIEGELRAIQLRAPLVVEAYRTRLTERLSKLLAEYDVQVGPADLIREVGLFSERSDISEEVVRLGCHIEQFRACMQLEEGVGRKLDFVTQEMFRETNTIGSKSSDVEISHRVVEIKTAVERIREMVQNVE